uniref:Uncharacterized protein n=1 Tax=Branchiostoma floridae TaxID=7739 RepID=C3YXJ9_BRAFL|eukprot:XP_002598796.1 hypothetical protein BRAFLDRAFT_74525 [Branchiostoma floridae]
MGGKQSKPEAKLPDLDAKRFQKYNFPFENIVMEGGGAKGIAYIGAVKMGGKQSKPEAKLPDLDAKIFRKYNFPFENIVMEGGGAKGIAYIGAVKQIIQPPAETHRTGLRHKMSWKNVHDFPNHSAFRGTPSR